MGDTLASTGSASPVGKKREGEKGWCEVQQFEIVCEIASETLLQ